MRAWTYARAGVDLSRVRRGQGVIAEMLGETFSFRRGIGSALHKIGHYAGLIDLGGGRALALHVDGAGTKVLVAQMANRFDTIGIDCVAMNVNDIICVGAEPLAFLDYLAMERANDGLIREVMKGIVEGARQASVTVVGGETAVMPDMLKGDGGRAFDLVGMAVGMVEKGRIITGRGLKVGDAVIGVESSGLHSNGFSLARKVLLSRYRIDEEVPELGRTLGVELLTPTRIYVKPVLEALRRGVEVSGLAHITGGGFSKLKRLCHKDRMGFQLDRMPEPKLIFNLIQREGRVSAKEMHRTFNMGIGLIVCAPKEAIEYVIKNFRRYRMRAFEVGRVGSRAGVYLGRMRVD